MPERRSALLVAVQNELNRPRNRSNDPRPHPEGAFITAPTLNLTSLNLPLLVTAFRESLSPPKLFGLSLIAFGVACLHLSSS